MGGRQARVLRVCGDRLRVRRWHMFTGCGTALVTPFQHDLTLDESTLSKLVRRQIEAGINFLVPCGTTGESPTLTREEHLRVVEITLEEAKGKVPVLAGAGGYTTHEVIEVAGEWGADPARRAHRIGDRAADRGVQRPGAHGRERRAGDAGAAGANRKHRRSEG